MGQKEYPAMSAARETLPQTGFGPQHGPEHEIVLQHQAPDLALAAVPTRPELKILLDLYDQKPSVSLMILMCLGMLRPTRSARRVSRGRTRLFSAARRLPFLLGKKITSGGQFI